MREVTGNLWTYPADVRVITTNGFVKKNGECVMGRGCALEAKTRYPGIAVVLGTLIRAHGNHVYRIWGDSAAIYSFPVKHMWDEVADPELIARSALELVAAIDNIPTNNSAALATLRIVIPRPGCGNGSLRWEDVRPILQPILDDRFHIITFGR